MSDVPPFTAHLPAHTYRVDQQFTTGMQYANGCHIYQFPPNPDRATMRAIGENDFTSRQECADWIEANLPGVTVEWNVQQCRLPAMWGAPPLEPWT